MPDESMAAAGPSTAAHSQTTQYATRIDRFRAGAGIDLVAGRNALQVSRSTLARIRGGRDVRVDTLARLVRTARMISGKEVRAGDLFHVGEDDEPASAAVRPTYAGVGFRKVYETPLDELLIQEGLKPAAVARKAGITRHTLKEIRAAREVPRVSTVAAIVGALRALTGKPIRAADLWDVGETEPGP